MKTSSDTGSKINLNLTANEWIYRGEGNANVVLSLPEHRQILRIRKTEKPKTLFERLIDFLLRWLNLDIYGITDDTPDTTSKNTLRYGKLKTVLDQIISWMVQILNNTKYKSVIYRELRDLKFYKRIVRPVLGTNYTCDATSVYISKDQIKEIELSLASIRPDYRKNKRLCYGKATLFEDFALLPQWFEKQRNLIGDTYSIEIKPKQGWYPESERDSSKCQFCMKQYLKYQRGQIKKFSSYCPLNLFSGNKEKMLKAINALIENPQNNFSIFENGITVYGDNFSIDSFYSILPKMFGNSKNTEDLLSEFCELVQEVLTKKMGINGCATCCDGNCLYHPSVQDATKSSPKYNLSNVQLEKGECSYGKSDLPKGCVLEKILNMQTFNEMGLEYYSKLCKSMDLTEANDWAYVDALLEIVASNKNLCTGSLKDRSDLTYNFNATHRNLFKYLMFSIARDCSLMISFRRISGDVRELEDCLIQRSGGNFAFNVGVFDLYPKPISTIKKAIKRNVKIVDAYRSLSDIR